VADFRRVREFWEVLLGRNRARRILGDPQPALQIQHLQKMKIKKKQLPKWAAALFTMFIMVTVLFSAGALIIPELMSELELLSTIDFKGVYSGLEDSLFKVEEKLAEMSLDAELGMNTLRITWVAFSMRRPFPIHLPTS
jgi:hypothetical protein